MSSSYHSDHEATQRSGVYAILARTFLKEPDSELIRYFQQPEVQTVLRELDCSFGDDFLTAKEDALARGLAVEYARLFLVPPRHIPPYESFFVGGAKTPKEVFEPALQGKASVEVQDFYRDHGICFAKDSTLFPDHIGIELEALHLMCAGESRAAEANDPDRARQYRCLAGKFLAEHPGRWVFTFCDRILEIAEDPFYRVVAQLTKAFLETEMKELAPCSV